MRGDEVPTRPAVAWAVLPLAGDVDLASAPALRLRLNELSEEPPAFIVLDTSELDFIDSTGLGVLVGALRRIRTSGGDLRIAAAPSPIARVFAVTGLDRVFRLFPTVEEAREMPTEEGEAPA